MRESSAGDATPYLAWLAFLGAAAALLLADRLTFVTPGNLHALLVAAEVVFVLFAWPFLDRAGRGGAAARGALLGVLALPVALMAENISAVGAGALIRGQLLVVALAALVSALRAGEDRRAPSYLLVAALLCAGLPIAAFLVREFGGGDLGWLALFSPVWAALLDGRWTGLLLAAFAASGAVVIMAFDRPEAAA